MNVIKDGRNRLIDCFRYICAVMVIAIHTHPFTDVNYILGYISTNIMTRIAVPFFFAISGYYFTKHLFDKRASFKTIKKIIKKYFFWSIVYMPIYFISAWGDTDKGILQLMLQYVYKFFVGGTAYHFWFFPALVYAMVSIYILNRFKAYKIGFLCSIILYIFGCGGVSYYYVFNHFTLLNEIYNSWWFLNFRSVCCMGFPFVYLGSIVAYKAIIIDNDNHKLLIGAMLITLLFITEITLVNVFHFGKDIFITFMLYPLMLIFILILTRYKSTIFLKNINTTMLHYMANFMFYTHPIVMLIVEKLFPILLNIEIQETPLFIIVTLVTTIVGYILAKMPYKFSKILIN